jgi:uracil-DNA glycosylase
VFVLGVYASAVHARWLAPDGSEIVKALAVASEPYIFWKGDGAEQIISKIKIPKTVGTLTPAHEQFNGPSGLALDQYILAPLGVKREDAWLCDLVPHSCVNSSQQQAIDRAYMPLIAKHGLPVPSVPQVPAMLADDARRTQILDELRASKAELLILLGDEPLRWFLRFFTALPKRLAQFKEYGRPHPAEIDGLKLRVMPLAHPRQVAKLGLSAQRWYLQHQRWMERAPRLSLV